MHELHAILDAWRDLPPDCDAVLATVVHVTGSAYRRPGARMLILPDGRRVGSMSGGCLEGEITTKAWWFTGSDAPALRVYDTTSDDDAVWEFGLGCNGVVSVMLERVSSAAVREMLAFLNAHRASDKSAAVAVVIRAEPSSSTHAGDRFFIDHRGVRGGALAASPDAARIFPHARAALDAQQSRLVRFDDLEVFVEYIGPPLSLVVFGAGHDAVPVVSIAAQLGWRVTVADGRPAYARPDRFPAAQRVVVMPPGDPLRHVSIDSETAVVLMTHNYPLDARLLPRILPLQPRYLGLLGPRRRAQRLFSELGVTPPAYVHSPVGLDLGGDGPSAVALSIVSEIHAAIHSRDGGMLKQRAAPIHAAVVEAGSASPPVDAARPSWCETMVGHDA